MKFINKKCELFLSVFVALGLTGCITQQTVESGSFYTSEISQSRIASIATDSAEFLAWKYPVAKTTFDFAPSNDYFGTVLRDKLRTHGFKVSENTGSGSRTKYITDNDSSAGYIRVILYVDNVTYAKNYSVNQNGRDLKWTSVKNTGAGK